MPILRDICRRAVACLVAAVGLPILLSPTVAAQEQTEPFIDFRAVHHPVIARNGLVVSQEEFASKAGVAVMQQGGNAIDAAVATAFALAVTHPQAGNLGGGGFIVAWIADEKRHIALDFREMAPAAATADMFLDEEGNPDQRKVRFSMSASGVPGSVMGLLTAHERYGKLDRAAILAPAIRLAEEGFAVDWSLHLSLDRFGRRMLSDEAAASVFFKSGGAVYQPGEILRQPDLAATLKAIAERGTDGFYKGAVAAKIAASVQAGGGLITEQDLGAYRAVDREPLMGRFQGYDVISMPPPSSGGVHIVQMLNMLDQYDLRAMGHNSAQYIHTVAEVMKRAYADRAEFLGDPDFFPVPKTGLTSRAYTAELVAGIKSDRATPSSEIGHGNPAPYESPDTTHLSTADSAGNLVALTTTLNFSFGNAKMAAGTGVLMNNEMDDFSAKPGVPNAFGLIGREANKVEPGKRPLSSMTPTLLMKDGQPVLATGAAGGSRIITAVLQILLNATVFEMNPAEAAHALRFHHQWLPDALAVERGVSVDTRRLLRQMGHPVNIDPLNPDSRLIGSAQTLKIRADGVMLGASEPRRPGAYAAGY